MTFCDQTNRAPAASEARVNPSLVGATPRGRIITSSAKKTSAAAAWHTYTADVPPANAAISKPPNAGPRTNAN